MYAVIRAGGKQYRVSPGDIVRIEKVPAGHGETFAFKEVLAVSAEDGKIASGNEAVVSGQVMDTGRGDKVLVFHYKRKKQYKKIYGHRQPYTDVRITEIAFDGQRFTAPELPPRKKAEPAPAEPEAEAAAPEAEESAAEHKAHAAPHKK